MCLHGEHLRKYFVSKIRLIFTSEQLGRPRLSSNLLVWNKFNTRWKCCVAFAEFKQALRLLTAWCLFGNVSQFRHFLPAGCSFERSYWLCSFFGHLNALLYSFVFLNSFKQPFNNIFRPRMSHCYRAESSCRGKRFGRVFFHLFFAVPTTCPKRIGQQFSYTCETNLPGLGNVSEICIQANTDPKFKHIFRKLVPPNPC